MQLVDEQDLPLGVLARLVYDLLEALLELAPVLGAGHRAREIQRQDTPPCQCLRNLVIDNPLEDHGGLADAGISYEHGVVFVEAGKALCSNGGAWLT